MSRRMLYDDEGSKQQFKATMEEKRSALTSLRAHKKKYVGSIRTGIAVRDANPGVVNQENIPSNVNTKLEVHEDEHEAVALPANTSVIRSMIDSARKKENVHEPGPWNKAKTGKSGNLFGKAVAAVQPGFCIMEDESLPPIPCKEKLYEQGIKLPADWVTSNKPQKPWNIPVVVEEPIVAKSFPCYEKFLLYPNGQTEISPDEYRGYKWFKDRGMQAPVVDQFSQLWMNLFETPIRIPPGFATSSVKQVEKENYELFIDDDQKDEFQVPLEKMYPKEGAVVSLEEMMAERFKRGEMKILTASDFEEIDSSDNMDITVIGDRRHSIYPMSRKSFVPRKSIMPRKSVMPSPSLEEVEEEDEEASSKSPNSFKLEQPTGTIRKTLIKRKSQEENDENSSAKRGFVSETPPRSNFNEFKPPAPVEKKPLRAFEIIEDDDAICFNGNDTCSTQQFNFFIKAQSVSTPVSKKSVPRLLPMSMISAETLSPPEAELQSDISPTNRDSVAPGSTTNCPPKHLSTIMETTEQSSTKSSVSHASAESYGDANSKTPKHLQSNQHIVPQQEVEKRLFNPLVASFRMPEENTETCANIQLVSVHALKFDLTVKSLRTPEIIETPAFEIFQDDSMSASPQLESPSDLTSPIEIVAHPEIEIPATQEVQDHLEIPTSKRDESQLQIPIGEEESVLEIPATQFDESQSETPLTQKIGVQIEIPATQEFKSDVEFPATEKLEENFVIPTVQEVENVFDIPATQEIPSLSQPDIIQAEAEKNASFKFNIYEDSVLVQPPKASAFTLPDDEGTGFLHVSRKENLIVQPPLRSASDEFLDLLVSPSKPARANQSKVPQNELSDFLKFSQNSGMAGSLENSLKGLSLDTPKSATPTSLTPPLFDEDLNTEKFSLALGNFKNSTLLEFSKKQAEKNYDLDFSIAIDDDELERLGMSTKAPFAQPSNMPEFKVPQPPMFKVPAQPVKAPPTNFEIFEDDDVDLSKSIYVHKPELDEEQEDQEPWEDKQMCSFIATPYNQYEHSIVEDPNNLSSLVQQTIKMSAGNPFDSRIRDAMLEHCNFSVYLETHVRTCTLLKRIPKLCHGISIECGGEDFSIVKLIAKGGFGNIYAGKSVRTGKIWAMKQEKPANLWEFYVCVELMDRLKDKRMIPAFMSIDYAIVANNSSVLVTEFSPFGSIIDVCNKFKNVTNKNVDEYVVMVLTSQLLSIIDHLHGCKIIHADIKPDNFLLMNK